MGQVCVVAEVMGNMCVPGVLSIWGEGTLGTLCLHLETHFLHASETGRKKLLSNPQTIPVLWGKLRKGLPLVGGSVGSEADLAQIGDLEGDSWAQCQ